MRGEKLKNNAGILLTVAILWAIGGAFGLVQFSGAGLPTALADDNPCNPVAPGAAAVPAPGEGDSGVPWDTAADFAAAVDEHGNPCNPCGGAGQAGKVRIEDALDYLNGGFEKTTGFVQSAAHGNRLLLTFVSPAEAAEAYRHNARLVRRGGMDFQAYPEGTVILSQSFHRTGDGRPSHRGPIFLMKKEAPGYDTSGNDWRYQMAQPDMTTIADGNTGNMRFCKSCHMSKRGQDFVFSVDR